MAHLFGLKPKEKGSSVSFSCNILYLIIWPHGSLNERLDLAVKFEEPQRIDVQLSIDANEAVSYTKKIHSRSPFCSVFLSWWAFVSSVGKPASAIQLLTCSTRWRTLSSVSSCFGNNSRSTSVSRHSRSTAT